MQIYIWYFAHILMIKSKSLSGVFIFIPLVIRLRHNFFTFSNSAFAFLMFLYLETRSFVRFLFSVSPRITTNSFFSFGPSFTLCSKAAIPSSPEQNLEDLKLSDITDCGFSSVLYLPKNESFRVAQPLTGRLEAKKAIERKGWILRAFHIAVFLANIILFFSSSQNLL